MNKRNKYFDPEARGSIFGLSNETPTLIAQDQQDVEEQDNSINVRKGTMAGNPLKIIDENDQKKHNAIVE